tara:strand:+ start:7240 stop:7482 length:243 start_codon:yes stop_codon:yes gene_type:complete
MTVERLPIKPKKAKKAGCPTCGLPASKEHGPFCSKRCKEIDLGKWFSGTYAIPAAEPPDSAEMEELIEAIEADKTDDKFY